MQRPLALRSSCLLLLTLSGCFTTQLWDHDTPVPEWRSTPRHVRACEARLQRMPSGNTLNVRLELDRARHVLTLLPHDGYAEAFDEAVNDDPQLRRTLRIAHSHLPDGREQWHARLEATAASGTRVIEVPFSLSFTNTDAEAPAGVPLLLHTVTWTEIEKTTMPPGTLDIAWRVAVTPFAVAADLVCAIPYLIIVGIIYLNDPGALSGG